MNGSRVGYSIHRDADRQTAVVVFSMAPAGTPVVRTLYLAS